MIDLLHKPAVVDNVVVPLYLKLYLIRVKNTESNYVKKDMITRAIIKSFVTNTPVEEIDLLTINQYEKYLDPNSYTSEQEYMMMYMQARIKNIFGLSFDEYISSPISRMYMMYNIGKKETESQVNTMNGLTNEIGEMIDGE